MMNLCTNAAQAMRDAPGRLGVRLERVVVDAALAANHAGLRQGAYVRVSVSDTGHGMDPATLDRIFEPFFTTKAPGEGTGLGLAVVHGIVQSHEGVITVYSQPGEGTLFRLYFPTNDEVSADIAIEPAELPRGAGQRILYVDDEETLAWMGRQVLERIGYAVEIFTDPTEALATFAAEAGRYDLVITDLAMPKMAGTELAQRMLGIRANMPIILITGYTTIHTTSGLRALGIREMVLKPLSVHALATTVHRIFSENQTN
jgi:CheY-like chemotaxis protein